MWRMGYSARSRGGTVLMGHGVCVDTEYSQYPIDLDVFVCYTLGEIGRATMPVCQDQLVKG
jgi:hypothetical protein